MYVCAGSFEPPHRPAHKKDFSFGSYWVLVLFPACHIYDHDAPDFSDTISSAVLRIRKFSTSFVGYYPSAIMLTAITRLIFFSRFIDSARKSRLISCPGYTPEFSML